MSPDPLPKPLLQMLSIMSLELRGAMLATQDNIPEAEKLFAAARREEKELGYHEPPFYIRPVSESEAAALIRAGKWAEAEAAFQKALVDRPKVPTESMNATGDKLLTDGRMAVLVLGAVPASK